MDFTYEKNRIFLADYSGGVLAEVTFPAASESIVNIDHTFVDASLRGQGIAGKLLTAVADQLRADGKKADLSCSYAVKWFDEHPDYADVKAK